MQKLFSTDGFHPRNRLNLWRETLSSRGLSFDLERLDEAPFQGKAEVVSIGSLHLTRLSQEALRGEVTSDMVRRNGQDGTLFVTFQLAGVLKSIRDDQSTVQRQGDLVVFQYRPGVLATSPGCQSLYVELPRERLESMLGPARLYTSLTTGADLASNTLARTFLHDLIRARHQLTPDAAERMAAIGVDLIVASIAERLAQDLPRSIHGNVTVQRAKAYVQVNLSDPTLDPPQLAVAMGMSLRRLQELFHERGQHIADYIWHRRLQTAAERLADPACDHLGLGVLAYGCGFISQAHFSRRFKDRFGMTPSQYRQAATVTMLPARH
jgi:AraC family transcriptional activator of tynA and feaB